MDNHEIDLSLREVFKRNAPSFDDLHLAPLTRPAGLWSLRHAPRRGVLRPLALTVAVLVVAVGLGAGVWQAVSHLGATNPIVVITDQTTSTAPIRDPQSQIKDGEWELHVDRQSRTEDAKTQTELLPESAYQSVDVAPTFRIVISEGASKVLIEEAQPGYQVHGTRTTVADGRIWYTTDAPWGGRFVIWQTADGLQAEETIYGTGKPILHSYRGKLVKARIDDNGSVSTSTSQTAATGPLTTYELPPAWALDSLNDLDTLLRNADGYCYYYIIDPIPAGLTITGIDTELDMSSYTINFENEKKQLIPFTVDTLTQGLKDGLSQFDQMMVDGVTYYYMQEFSDNGEFAGSYFTWFADGHLYYVNPQEPITPEVIRKYSHLKKLEFNLGQSHVGLDTRIPVIGDSQKINQIDEANEGVRYLTRRRGPAL